MGRGDRLARLEAVLAERTNQVDRLLSQQEKLVRHLGHDLKTPLTPLVAILPLIRDQIEDAEVLEMLDVVIDSVGYIHALADQALSLADLPRMEPVLEEVDLAQLVDHVSGDLRSMVTVDNRLSRPCAVLADRLMAHEALKQLLDNAVVFSQPGDSVVVESTVREGRARIEIHDRGVGMSDEQVARAFDEFYKADPARGRLGSGGLGLSICRRLVESLGGTVELTSQGLGCGTTAVLELPTVTLSSVVGGR